MKYKYYELDGAYFRGRADAPGIGSVWHPRTKEWGDYRGADTFWPAFFGTETTKEESESSQ
jgi:hypothetical protein